MFTAVIVVATAVVSAALIVMEYAAVAIGATLAAMDTAAVPSDLYMATITAVVGVVYDAAH